MYHVLGMEFIYYDTKDNEFMCNILLHDIPTKYIICMTCFHIYGIYRFKNTPGECAMKWVPVEDVCVL